MRLYFLAVGASVLAVITAGFAATNFVLPPLDFDELRAVIQTNLPGVTKAELDRQGVQGLLQGFRGKVRLLAAPAAEGEAQSKITRSTVYDGGIAYLRVPEVFAHLSRELGNCCQAMNGTNKLKGVVVDLRFADGEDYAAAVSVTDLFVAEEKDLLDWGQGMARSTAKTNALDWPVVVLVNGETAGAAEALAALLRDTGTGLILGSRTIGAAMTSKEFVLSNGQRLRIATDPIKLAGGDSLPPVGLTPDILVNVTPADEQFYWNDPFGQIAAPAVATNSTASVTNRVLRRVRTNEADLVRARKQGLDLDEETIPQREPESDARVIRDPALGRAVDLLKGLALVRRAP
jgi:hypothetical protein